MSLLLTPLPAKRIEMISPISPPSLKRCALCDREGVIYYYWVHEAFEVRSRCADHVETSPCIYDGSVEAVLLTYEEAALAIIKEAL